MLSKTFPQYTQKQSTIYRAHTKKQVVSRLEMILFPAVADQTVNTKTHHI